MWLLALVACGSVAPQPTPAPTTVVDRDWMVDLGPERDALTLAYAQAHTGPDQGVRIQPTMVVLHGTMDRDLATHHARLKPVRLPADRQSLAWAGEVNVMVHFVVAPDGEVVRVLPEDHYGRHAVGFNHVALGIEHLGDGPEHALTDAQVASTTALIRELADRHALTHLAGHHQLIAAPEQHPLFRERDDTYRTLALDPGDAFVEAVAGGVADLGLALPE